MASVGNVSGFTGSYSAEKRMMLKVCRLKLAFPEQHNWDTARVVTPGSICGYRTEKGLRFIDFTQEGWVKSFFSGSDSHALFYQKGIVQAASVTTSIQNPDNRKNEKKGTYVQYDKTDVRPGAFKVDATNYKGQVNYQGCHMIDYKYSTGGAHTDADNYYPGNYFINSPLKEYLAKKERSDAYVEIPLYVPNSPTIKVKRKATHQAIPIGVILVQVKGNAIEDVYYFPNGKVDYKKMCDDLHLKKDLAQSLLPRFKLDKELHPLFLPALIEGSDFKKQEKHEEQFLDVMMALSYGMRLEKCSESENPISKLAFTVIHEEPKSEFKVYLVKTAVENALKSEVLSTDSRLVFLNGMIDFIEGHSQVSAAAIQRVDKWFANIFWNALEELDTMEEMMELEELLFLADIYARLADEFNEEFAHLGNGLFDYSRYEQAQQRVLSLLLTIGQRFEKELFEYEELPEHFLVRIVNAPQIEGPPSLALLSPLCLKLIDLVCGEEEAALLQFEMCDGQWYKMWTTKAHLKMQVSIL